MFNWYDLNEGKLNLTFNNRITVQVGIYAKEDDKTSHLEEVYPMVNIQDQTNFSIALNMSNAFMLSTILSLYVESDTIKEYFNKTNLSNGWYVSQKYVDKPVYNKTLTDKITLKLIPITDHRKIPMYKVKFIKNSNNTIEIDLTKAEMKSLSVLLSMFSANASVYSFIFRQSKQFKYVENQLKALESTNSILRSILDKLSIPQNHNELPVVPVIEPPEIDFTNTSNVVNNVDIVRKPIAKHRVSKKDELDIDSLDMCSLGESEEKFKQLVEDKTGVKISDKDSFDSISIDVLFPKEGDEGPVIEPIMNRSVIDIDSTKAILLEKEEREKIVYSLAKKHNIDRRTKNQSFIYSIAKKGLLDPKVLPTLLNHRGMIGTPVTSIIYSGSLFASAYKYLDTYKDLDISEIAVVVYKALQMSQVDSADMFDNNKELKEYGQMFMNVFIKSLLPEGIGITGIRTLDKYISLNHSEEDIFYNFSKLDISITDDNLKYLVKGLTDIYFLLWYGENKYIKNVKLSNNSGYLMDAINVPMYEFARSYLINAVVMNSGMCVDDMIKSTLDFEEMIKYATWDKETFKEAYIDLFSYYYRVIDMLRAGEKICVGMPCFS